MGRAQRVRMSYARRVIPGCTYLITRRTVQRSMLFRPERLVSDFYLYTLAVYATRYRIEVHGVVLMSNHEHLVVTDTEGCLPDFLRDFHRVVALGIQCLRNWEGEVWDGAATSCVMLCTPSAVVEKLAYAMNNPVKAGLVNDAEEWPGVMVLPSDLGMKTWKVQRPRVYYDANNSQWPAIVELKLKMPKHYLPDEQLREQVSRELANQRLQAQSRLRTQGKRVVGRAGVMTAPPESRARRAEDRRGLQPTIAAGHGQKSILMAALAALREFRRKYRDALARWRGGLRDVLFPPYTWQMRWLHRVALEPASS
jgi:putative transposase